MVLGGRYRLVERLAGGGMADVWLGSDELLGRSVAVKILSPRLAADDVDRERFREEARTAAGLTHPGIAAVHDFGEAYSDPDPGRATVAYLVMELVAGQSLAGLLKSGPLGVGQTIDLVVQTARALDYAHRNGVVHRDVKPANLMVTPQHQVKVTDFGIARRHDHDPLTATGLLVGTPDYLSPEVSRGASATAQADIYALGVVAYECLTGRRPFRGNSSLAILTAHVEQQPEPLPPSVPSGVAAAVMTAMQKDPRRRFATAGAFADALELLRDQQLLRDQPGPADPTITMARPAVRPRPDARRMVASPMTVGLRAAAPATQGMRYVADDYDDFPDGGPDPLDDFGPRRHRGVRRFALMLVVVAVVAGIAAFGTAQGRTLFGRLMATGARPTSGAAAPAMIPAGTVGGAAAPQPDQATQAAAMRPVMASPGLAPARAVPDVAGRSVTRARNLLGEAGFKAGNTIRVDSTDVAPGHVVRTDPPAGSTAAPGSRIDLYVAGGGVTVPDLTGHQLADALDILQNQLRLQVTVQYQTSDQPAGTVIGQDVRNTTVAQGSSVTLTVSGQPGAGGQTGQTAQTGGATTGGATTGGGQSASPMPGQNTGGGHHW
jgi:serine/threonine-protein kinase